jgi:hypothetical protein
MESNVYVTITSIEIILMNFTFVIIKINHVIQIIQNHFPTLSIDYESVRTKINWEKDHR